MNICLCVLVIILCTGGCSGKYDPCAITRCQQNEVCKLESVLCFTTPCPGPKAVCRPKTKKGFCPPPKLGFYGPCASRCANDADCLGTSKCCGICPRRCRAPVPAPPPPKLGKCPNFSGSTLSFCQVKCKTDYDCPGTSKCCGSCPRQCTSPVRPKPLNRPGSCPRPSGNFGPCFATCIVDEECPGVEKCCGGCPRVCKNPVVLVKPGTCPSFPQQDVFFTNCQTPAQCNVDNDCDGARKCCGRCPRKCVFPTAFNEV